MKHVPILIVGGGPAGLTLAADLGWRGHECLLVEELHTASDHPRATLLSARSMEFYRRWGIDDDVLAAGLPSDYLYEIVFATRLCGHVLRKLTFVSAHEFLTNAVALSATLPDANWSPYYKTQIGQQALEPVLRSFASSFDSVELRHGWKLLDFDDTGSGVIARLAHVDTGREETVTADYIVGCDGGRSVVRNRLGISYTGRGAIRPNVSFFFRSSEFWSASSVGRGTLYFLFSPESFGVFTAIDGRELWNYQHYFLDPAKATDKVDPYVALPEAMGKPFAFEVLRTTHWHHHQSVATRFRKGRAFIAGDAAHLFCPTGGMGMNTAIGDAIDLSWKISGVLEGWGGSELLDSYDTERRPVATRNTIETADNAARIDAVMRDTPSNVEDDTPAGERSRVYVAERIEAIAGQFSTSGLALGYRYVGSPICIPDGTPEPPDRPSTVTQSTWPSCRAPHAWLLDGRSTLDLFNSGAYTLLRFGADGSAGEALLGEARRQSVPLQSRDVTEPDVAALYEKKFVLVRPDGHVAWRSDTEPDGRQATEIISVVRGAQVAEELVHA